MGKIHLLSSSVIDKIAAGEAVERPAAVAKELIENAIDAGADAVTVEIRDGGITYLRVTDNGSGIAPEDVRTAFLRHATSKIETEKDLERIGSLGFRGEALASIAAVSRVELITKRPDDLSGTRYVIEGGEEKGVHEVGAPDGTTFIIRDLFYNTPARQKFLKTAMTEASRIASSMEQLALSNPDIAFSFIVGGQLKMQSSGNGSLKDVIFRIYGKSVVQELLPVEESGDSIRISGWIAKPAVFRSSRNYENYYVNGRYVKSNIIAKAIEDGYGNMLMQHNYPFTCLMVDVPADEVDVNVHPQKMEVRFSEEKRIYDAVRNAVHETIRKSIMIVPAVIGEPEKEKVKAAELKEARKAVPEPFEKKYREKARNRFLGEDPVPYKTGTEEKAAFSGEKSAFSGEKPAFSGEKPAFSGTAELIPPPPSEEAKAAQRLLRESVPEQETIPFLSPEAAKKRKIIGQAFSTYWIIEYGDELLIIDQHAAHEKVLYERFMRQYKDKQVISQPLLVPAVITTDARDRMLLEEYREAFAALGFEIESFGDTEYKISSIPYNLSGADVKQLFHEILGAVEQNKKVNELPSYVHEVATEACKAAVKGGGELSTAEAEALIGELMQCEDPYHCPHGRPTIISMTKQEFEKKFKRIV
ncbi:MAG: DNA mismatch repair endonuclease MutL [Lachnospiraceae bacterium]|nr:DNA mismatch repair endonuclease MutL [Lachnospiraceae bacterium]